jgi:porin
MCNVRSEQTPNQSWRGEKPPGGRGTRATLAALLCSALASTSVRADDPPGIKDRLIEAGVSPSATYDGAAAANLAGGARRGQSYSGILHVQLALDGDHIAATPGLTGWLDTMWGTGGQPGKFVGDAQGVSNIAAAPALRLYEAWLQYNFADNRFSVLAGRYDLNTEFYHLTSASLFLNSSFAVGPEFALSGFAGPSIFPDTSLAVRLADKPDPNIILQGAILTGAPLDRINGSPAPFNRHSGVLLVAEAAYTTSAATGDPGTNGHSGIGRQATQAPYDNKVAVGGWYYTAGFNDLSKIDANGAPVRHPGEAGAYLVLDRLLFQADQLRASGFVQAGVASQAADRFGTYIGAGLAATGVFAGRPDDQLGIAAAMARNGSHYLVAQRQDGRPVNAAETSVELTYLAQVTPWLGLQPDVQYVIHPNTDPHAGNATVVQFRSKLAF